MPFAKTTFYLNCVFFVGDLFSNALSHISEPSTDDDNDSKRTLDIDWFKEHICQVCFERQLHFKGSSYKSQMQIHSCRENTKCLGRGSSVAKVLEEYNGETGNRDALTSVGLFAVLI